MAIRWDNIDLAQPVNWQYPLTRGLKAWWIGIPTRGTGVRWIDLCQRLPAVLTNMTPHSVWSCLTNGVFSPIPDCGLRALNFTAASSQYALCSTPAVVDLPATLSVNFRLTSVGSALAICSVGADTARLQINCTAASPAVIQAASITSGGTIVTASSTTTLAASHYATACGVFASTASRSIAINGTIEATDTNSNATGSFTRTVIGARYASGSPGAFLNGRVVDFKVWNRALTAKEVAQDRKEFLCGYPSMLRRLPFVIGRVPDVVAAGAARLINGGPLNHPIFGGLVAAPEY